MTNGMLDLVEDDLYYFDTEAADRPVRFMSRYLRFYKGRFAGKPFKLEPLQARIIRDCYGWKHRSTGFRRFNHVYWEGAVSAGKSPILAAIGLYGLIADREQGAEIYGFAKTHPQARIVFDTAKKFIKESPALAARLEVRHAEIRHPASNSFWKIVPGTGPGAGANPSMALGDEVADWSDSVAYDDIFDRMTKRDQPLMICATNAGLSQASFCWRLREKAAAALEGWGDPGMYPVIWSAPDDAKTDDPNAWRQANPLIGVTIEEAKIAAKCAEMMKDEQEERKFRRLYLGIWPKKQAERWLDLTLWDAATPEVFTPPADSPVFVGVDLSCVDDLSAVVWVRPGDDGRFYVDAHMWLPRVTANRYEKAFAIPYSEWAEGGHITLLNENTVSDSAMVDIANAVLRRSGAKKPAAVCYDRFRADVCVKTLEAANVPCVPIAQGYSISPGCFELDKRLKAGSIVIAENPVLRWCAENVTVKRDDRGNLWPVKPGATDTSDGKRGLKIDGIAALVTALTQARKHVFPVKRSNVGARII